MLGNQIVYILFSLTIFFYQVQSGPQDLPCRLEWTPMSNGDANEPKNIVESQSESIYVARTKIGEEYTIGSYNVQVGLSFFPNLPDEENNSTAIGTGAFDVLTNPFNCTLKWVEDSNGNVPDQFSVPEDPLKKNAFIGRALVTDDMYNSKLWYAGKVSKEIGGIQVAIDEDYDEFYDKYQVLISFSTGMTLEISDFEFDTDPFGNDDDFLGIDEIHNSSPAKITQTLTHKKTITEKYKITTDKTWTSKYTTTKKINLIFFSIKKTTVEEYTHSETEVIETIDITEISVSREVVVPPQTSILACSTVSIKESVDIKYSAKAYYYALGASNEEVLDALVKDGVQGAKIVGDAVEIDINGEFTASLALNTEFFVSEFGSSSGCDLLQERIYLKNLRKQKANRVLDGNSTIGC